MKILFTVLALTITAHASLASIGFNTDVICETPTLVKKVKIEVQKIPSITGTTPVLLLAVENNGATLPSTQGTEEAQGDKKIYKTKNNEVTLLVEDSPSPGSALGRSGLLNLRGMNSNLKVLCYVPFEHVCGLTFVRPASDTTAAALALGLFNPYFPKVNEMAIDINIVGVTADILKDVRNGETICVEGQRLKEHPVPTFSVSKLLVRK